MSRNLNPVALEDLHDALTEAVDETILWGADHPLRLKWKAALRKARGDVA